MNKDKAIQLLERLQDPEPYEPMLTKDAYDAIQMAIDALSADGDTISRKAAVDVLHEALDRVDQIADVPFGVYQNYRDKMNELPPVQPERIRGHWIESESQCGIKCSNCGYPVDDFCYSIDYIDLDYAPNYCPNCGSDNREVTECLD